MRGHTAQNGTKTASHTRHSALTIQNKDPNFDYSMRKRRDVEDGGGQDIYGYEPITQGNNTGEVFGAFPMRQKTGGSKQMVYLDTIACKRPKEVSTYFKREEDERYNAQVRHVQSAAKRTRNALRELDPDSVVQDTSNFSGPSMKQRKGPTEE